MYNYTKISVPINMLALNRFKLGDGLVFAFDSYYRLSKMRMKIESNVLVNLLTDNQTFNGKGDFESFYKYTAEYLIKNSTNTFLFSKKKIKMPFIVYGINVEDCMAGRSLIPLNLFNYFHTVLWNKVVKLWVDGFISKKSNVMIKYLNFFYDDYSNFYDKKDFKTQDDITSKFLSDTFDFFKFNNILYLEEFDITEDGLILTIPIKVDFNFLE